MIDRKQVQKDIEEMADGIHHWSGYPFKQSKPFLLTDGESK